MFRESGWLRSFWTKAILSAIIDAHHCDVLTLRAAAGLLKRKIAAIGGSAPPGTGTRAVTRETIAPSVASLRRRSGSAAGLPRMIVRIGELAERPGCALLRPAHQIAFEEQLFGRGSFGAHRLHEVRWSI